MKLVKSWKRIEDYEYNLEWFKNWEMERALHDNEFKILKWTYFVTSGRNSGRWLSIVIIKKMSIISTLGCRIKNKY